MPIDNSFANSEESKSSSSSVVGSSGAPVPGMDMGNASTRVLVRGRLVKAEWVAVGGGAVVPVPDENWERTSICAWVW